MTLGAQVDIGFTAESNQLRGFVIRHQIGQQLIIGIQGHSLLEEEKRFIVENNIGGVCLFGRNVGAIDQLHALVGDLQKLRTKMPQQTPLFISVDMEGGRVARFKEPFTVWPPARRLGELDSANLGFKFAETMGKELRALGVNLNFAPSADVLTNPENKVIGDRSLGSDPEHVGKIVSSVARGFLKSGILACVKHFPGHGNTLLDSHEDLPVEMSDLERLRAVELVPFKKAFRARLDLVMTCHILFKNIDPEFPVTLSKKILGEILRKELGFKGLVVSDDLDMKGLRKHYSIEEIPVHGLLAGVNILLYCNEPESHKRALEALIKAVESKRLPQEIVEKNAHAVVQLKDSKIKNLDPIPLAELKSILADQSHKALAQAIVKGEVPDELKAN